MKNVIPFLIAYLFFGSAVNTQPLSQEAQFGLVWGTTAAEVRALGVELVDRTNDLKGFGQSYVATKLPKVISDAETVMLSFGFDDKLWRIATVSKAFPNDPYGAAVQSRYQELVGLLTEKYGAGKSSHIRDTEIWKAPSQFLMAINNGRSNWFTNFDDQSVFIQIGITSSDGSSAHWRIITENKLFRSDFLKSKLSREKSAL